MSEFGWTWHELQATPAYVRRFSCDFIALKREAQRAAAAKLARARRH